MLILARNEAGNLRELLPLIHRTLTRVETACEILVVDGSSDEETAVAATQGGARVIRQRQPGYGPAFREGIAAARGTYIVVIDADLSHDPAVMLRLWEHRNEAGVVIASRYVPGGSTDMPLGRKILSQTLNALCHLVFSVPVRDFSSAYRLYRREALATTDLRAKHFDVLEEVLVQLQAGRWKIREVPFEFKPRRRGRSNVRLLTFGWSFLRTFLRLWRLRG